MVGLKQVFQGLKIRIKNPFGEYDYYSFAEYFGDDSQLFLNDRPINLQNTDECKKLLSEYEKLVIQFRQFLKKANAPVNVGCCRTSCCGMYYRNLFHSNDQLEQMLEKNFDGRRFTVKSHDATPIDCMFFPFNDEKVLTKQEMD